MPLTEVRKKIDSIDDQLIRLFSERAECVHEVGVIKKREGLQIYAPEREELLLRKLAIKNAEANSLLPEKAVRAIYREIMSAALALEEDLKIAVLGPEGTWTHQAGMKKFGHSVDYVATTGFSDVFDLVERGKANYGVLPIENSFNGAVFDTLDLFVDSPLQICAQILLRIDHCLLSEIPKEQITELYSHPQVFGQCKRWINEEFPNARLVDCSSTADAAEKVKARGNNAAALGGALAGEIHRLPILERSIQDRATNTTRFLVLGEETCKPTGSDRTSILFSINDRPGALVAALGAFESFQVNLSKIESRPSKQKDWEYYFYVDVAGHLADPEVEKAISDLQTHCSMIKILGSYPDSPL